MSSFYTPPGRVSGLSVLILPAAAAASVVLAPLYAAASLFVPFIYANIALIVFYGAAAGLAGGLAARATVTLNPPLAGFLALLGGLVGFALSWVAWLSMLFSLGTKFPGFPELWGLVVDTEGWKAALSNPEALIESAKIVNSEGIWSIGRSASSSAVHGLPLLGVWIVEFLIFVVCCYLCSAKEAKAPYSFEAKAFLRREPKLPNGVAAPLDLDQLSQVTSGLASGDVSYFSSAPVVNNGESGFFATLRSHGGSPWGTCDVNYVHQKGKKMETVKVAEGIVLQLSTIAALRGRLS
ncbi:MAG: hypothetical protein LBQ12_11100 [Deltaproteobacteria bacterium]|jgi:hypothetical protein|nr:hypothetical protein [Deltaproteobacteria bacterium]